MEAHAQSIENHLIEGLDFSLGNGANYVTSRRSVTYQTTGGNLFSPAGIKVIRFQITGQEEMLDPSTSRIVFTITNTSGTDALKPASTYSFFRRMRLLVNGVLCEDCDFYARTYKTFEMLSDKNYVENLEAEGVGSEPSTVETIAANSSKIVCMPLLSGLLSQEKYVLLKVAPITLELELYSDPNQSVRTDGGTFSTSYALSDVQFKCDVVELDNGLANDYYSHLLQGKSLPIHYVTYTTISQVAASDEVNIQVSRSLTRMKSMFISLTRNDKIGAIKEYELFHHRMGGNYDFTQELEIEIQLGSNRYPVYPIRSAAEAYYQLKKTIGIHGSAHHAISISKSDYLNSKFLIGIDFEKILDRLLTGENTKNGNMLTIKLRKTGLDNSVGGSGMCYVTLMYDSICSIQDAGVLIYD